MTPLGASLSQKPMRRAGFAVLSAGFAFAAIRVWAGPAFSGGSFLPHGFCYRWDPMILWLHVISDGLIVLAYYCIPGALVYLARKRSDLPFNWIFWMFGLFIVGCGTTHLMEIWTIWHPSYLAAGVVKALTAAVSVATAIMLIPLIPKAITLPSPEQLGVVNRELRVQIEERARAERELKATLDARDRTLASLAERQSVVEELQLAQAELVHTREGMEAQARMLKLVLDSMGEGLVAADREGHFLLWNDSAKRLMGRDAADLPTEQWTPHYQVYLPDGVTPYPPDRLPLVRALRGESVQVELMVEHPEREGGVFLEVTARPMRDSEGNLCGGVAALRDITGRKQAEAALARQAEELSRQTEELITSKQALQTQTTLLESVLDSMDEGLVAADENGRFIVWNPAAEKIVGMGPAKVGSAEWTEHYGLYRTDTVTPFPPEQNPLARAIRGESCTTEMFVRNPELTQGAYIEAYAHPLNDASGKPRGGVVAFRDITLKRKAEQEIRTLNHELEQRVRQRTAQLEAANRELEAFSYSVSHDLRAPLRHISGFTKILVEDFGPTLPAEAQHHLERIEQGARRMGQLVDELLNLTRVGRQTLTMQGTGLNSVVHDVVTMLEPEMQGRKVEWKIADLPIVECDPILIRQVFQNLIGNALKYSRPRAHALIEIGHCEHEGKPAIFIRDNGVGFNMKYADKLFGVFQRLHRAEEFEGTGVGLATVQRIVQKHGGRVWAEAELDRGATFYFTLGDQGHAEAKNSTAAAGG